MRDKGEKVNPQDHVDAALWQKKEALESAIINLQEEVKAAEAEVSRLISPIGNIVHASVPVSQDEVFSQALQF